MITKIEKNPMKKAQSFKLFMDVEPIDIVKCLVNYRK